MPLEDEDFTAWGLLFVVVVIILIGVGTCRYVPGG